MEAARRVKGIGQSKKPIWQKYHGDGFKLLMVLHINDLVYLEDGERSNYYRVQKLSGTSNQIAFRLHSAGTLKNTAEGYLFSINANTFDKYNIRKVRINAIGKLSNDQADY